MSLSKPAAVEAFGVYRARSGDRTESAPGPPHGLPTPVAPIDRLAPADAPGLAAFLLSVGLDPAGLADPNLRAFVVRDGSQIVGSAAYELGDAVALLRSVAVRPDRRGRGLGAALASHALAEASREGATEALLLTDGAAGYFAAGGWQTVPRSYVDARFPGSQQVLNVCPASAAAMRKLL